MKSLLKRTVASLLTLTMSSAVCGLFTVAHAADHENLALSATAYAYTKRGTTNEFIPANGNDGDATTDWRTANKDAAKGKFVNGDGSVITWYALVFDEPITLNTIKLTFTEGQDAVVNYQLQLPAEGVTIDPTKLDTPSTEANAASADNPFYDNTLWQTIITAPDNTSKGRTDSFGLEAAVTTQYIRIFVPLDSRGSVVALQEIEVYNMNDSEALIDEMNTLIAEAESFTRDALSVESWTALQAALAQARAADTSDTAALTSAIEALTAAIDGVEAANLALSATPYAYGWAQQAKYDPNQTIDGVIAADNGWRSRNKGLVAAQVNGNDVTWFGLDFGKEIDLTTLKLTFTVNEDIVSTYQIQIPAEGVSIDLTDIDHTAEGYNYGESHPFYAADNWETVYTASEKSVKGRTDVVVLNVKTRYIRLYIPEEARQNAVRLCEIEAYSDYRAAFDITGVQSRTNAQDATMYDMRFVTGISKDFFEAYRVDIVEMGTLMVRKDQLTNAGKVDADIDLELFSNQTSDLVVKKLSAVYLIDGMTELPTDQYAFVNTIIAIDEAKLDVEYVTVSYIKFKNGTVAYSSACSRSMSGLLDLQA